MWSIVRIWGCLHIIIFPANQHTPGWFYKDQIVPQRLTGYLFHLSIFFFHLSMFWSELENNRKTNDCGKYNNRFMCRVLWQHGAQRSVKEGFWEDMILELNLKDTQSIGWLSLLGDCLDHSGRPSKVHFLTVFGCMFIKFT